jgi:hydrogenase nickel incorporation protein HypA/HybF
MHELAVTQSILDLAIEHANQADMNKISIISLVVGASSGVVPDYVRFAFDVLKKNSIAEQATLRFQSVPTQLKCRQCQCIFSPEDRLWSCPSCRSQRVDIIAGRELYMESIEGE